MNDIPGYGMIDMSGGGGWAVGVSDMSRDGVIDLSVYGMIDMSGDGVIDIHQGME